MVQNQPVMSLFDLLCSLLFFVPYFVYSPPEKLRNLQESIVVCVRSFLLKQMKSLSSKNITKAISRVYNVSWIHLETVTTSNIRWTVTARGGNLELSSFLGMRVLKNKKEYFIVILQDVWGRNRSEAFSQPCPLPNVSTLLRRLKCTVPKFATSPVAKW